MKRKVRNFGFAMEKFLPGWEGKKRLNGYRYTLVIFFSALHSKGGSIYHVTLDRNVFSVPPHFRSFLSSFNIYSRRHNYYFIFKSPPFLSLSLDLEGIKRFRFDIDLGEMWAYGNKFRRVIRVRRNSCLLQVGEYNLRYINHIRKEFPVAKWGVIGRLIYGFSCSFIL